MRNLTRSVTISLDMMGGDYGLSSTVPAAVKAVTLFPQLNLILCGNQDQIRPHLLKLNAVAHPRLQLVHCTEQVQMDDPISLALRGKPDSSMRVALDLVGNGQAAACVSAGNTGALLAIAHYVLKMISGIERPALVSSIPTKTRQSVYLLDLGANVDCEAHILVQFAFMAKILVQEIEGKVNPKVGLLNIGVEEIKGNQQVKQAADMLQQISEINYCGFIEGNDIFSGKVDIVVCEGFVGNVALKTCEGSVELCIERVRQYLNSHIVYRLFGWLMAPLLKRIFHNIDPVRYNGASLIGLNGIVIKSHGNAQVQGFLQAIKSAVCEVERDVPNKIKQQLANRGC